MWIEVARFYGISAGLSLSNSKCFLSIRIYLLFKWESLFVVQCTYVFVCENLKYYIHFVGKPNLTKGNLRVKHMKTFFLLDFFYDKINFLTNPLRIDYQKYYSSEFFLSNHNTSRFSWNNLNIFSVVCQLRKEKWTSNSIWFQVNRLSSSSLVSGKTRRCSDLVPIFIKFWCWNWPKYNKIDNILLTFWCCHSSPSPVWCLDKFTWYRLSTKTFFILILWRKK